MAHLLLLELPGGDDTDIVEAALRLGHELTFLTADLEHYRGNSRVMERLEDDCSAFHYLLSETYQPADWVIASRRPARLGPLHPPPSPRHKALASSRGFGQIH